MTTKRYAKVKNFIYENYKFILIVLLCGFFFLYPLPYRVDMPGGLLPLEKRVTVADGFPSSGSFNLSYVSEGIVTPSTYLLSFFRKDWEIIKESEIKYDHETVRDANTRGKLLLKQANQNALIVSYRAAEKTIHLSNPTFYVAYLDSKVEVDKPVKVGDILVKIDGKKIKNYDEILEVVKNSEQGDTIPLTIQRDKKELQINIKVQMMNDKKRIGLLLIPIYDITTDPQVEFLYQQKESGSSGGLMTALEIYNRLVEEDITHGKTIVGTGTLDANGNVGEIAGIEFKLRGAEKKHADIFFAPAGKNYEEAIKLKKKYHFKIKVIEIKTFDDALAYLKKLS